MGDDNKVIRVDFGAKKVVDETAKPAPAPGPFSQESQKKMKTMLSMLENGTVMLTIDARKDGVTVPPVHATTIGLNLNFDYEFAIPDFVVDEEGVSASLSFGGRDFWCRVPWDAIYGMRSHADDQLMIFPRSFPDELREMHPELARLADDEEE